MRPKLPFAFSCSWDTPFCQISGAFAHTPGVGQIGSEIRYQGKRRWNCAPTSRRKETPAHVTGTSQFAVLHPRLDAARGTARERLPGYRSVSASERSCLYATWAERRAGKLT